ncbi:MAG: BatD family protein [Anaerolineae bacterium]|nr:BatD family protein [Anaerolineae bacterium]
MPEFFIEAEVDNRTPYLGQQVTYILKRYQAVDFPNYPHYEDRPFIGFWDKPLLQQPTYTTTVQGREYRVHPTHIALFPTIVGLRTIEPARLIIPGDGHEPDTFIESQAITIQVQPLPSNPPDHFRGAVGQFEIRASFNNPEGQIDNWMNLIVEIEGTGNIEILTEPSIPENDLWTFEMFGSTTITDIPLSQKVVSGSRQFIWNVVPTKPGQQFFPAIRFSFFNPESNTYESIRTDPISVTIRADENASTFLSPIDIPQHNSPQQTIDIRHIKRVPNTFTRADNSTLNIFIYISGIIIPLALITTVWWHQAGVRKRDKNSQARYRRAKHRAKQRLAMISTSQASAAFMIYQIVSGYLTDKLNEPVTGLTAPQLAALLKKAQLPTALIERTNALLTQVDAFRFAPGEQPPAAIQSLLQEANHLTDDLERFFTRQQ